MAVYHFCCPYSRIPQGKECVQGKPLSGFPCTFNQRPPTAALIFAERKSAAPKESHPSGGSLLVRPTGFEPAAYRVGVIKPSSRKALRHKGLVGIAQISAILKKTSEALQGRASEVFCGSSQIVVRTGHKSCNSVRLSGLSNDFPVLHSMENMLQ